MDNQLSIITTADGSKTIFNPGVGESYHSKHGALQESMHVFIHEGLAHVHQKKEQKEISILEVGFGSGLNFLLSAAYAFTHQQKLNYTGIEPYPLSRELLDELDYEKYEQQKGDWTFIKTTYLSSIKTGKQEKINEWASLKVEHDTLLNFQSTQLFDLVYYDAFAPLYQPEIWERENIEKVCSLIKPGGIFVTYSITGNLKRLLKELGFSIEKPPGAVGKREMLRATKLIG